MSTRSHLYVPGDAPDKLGRALERGADAVIVDLEDAVAPNRKQAAREAVACWLDQARPNGTEVWVRVNPGALRAQDVAAVALSPALTGLCLAKTQAASDVEQVDAQLRQCGSSAELSPLLESAAAVLAAPAIARAPRVRRLQVGEADLRAELGVVASDDERELLLVRSTVVLASAAAGIEAPLGPVSTDFRDLDRLRASTLALARLGYLGRACIHPAQVAVVNELFTPRTQDLDRARDLLRRFDAGGGGVVLDADGRMVDEAVVRAARRVVALAPRVEAP